VLDILDCAPLDEEVTGDPGEASGLVLDGGGNAQLTWTMGSQGAASNVYRNTISATPQADWSCLVQALSGVSHAAPTFLLVEGLTCQALNGPDRTTGARPVYEHACPVLYRARGG